MWDWDEPKRQANLAKHGVDFADARDFEWETAQTEPDLRYDYGEQRFESVGHIGERLYVLIFTQRGDRRRLISLRKANTREIQRWYT
ncbi:MAG: BrnT family toxin [Pseudomonadota bacterium]